MALRKSFGAEVVEIANELGIPKATVEAVLRTRLTHQVNELRKGNSITVEGLFTIKATKLDETDPESEVLLRGSVSTALKNAVNNPEGTLRMLRE